MKKIAYLLLLAAAALGAGEAPSFEQFKSAIRPDHPRLFITADGIPAFRERALGSCRNYFDALKAKVDALPDDPVLTVKPDIAEMKGDVLVFKKNVNDQNAVKYALNTIGGVQALECTIVYLVTNEEQYRQKALKYLEINRQFFRLADRSKILPEWFNCGRLAAIVAWDWLYNTMTPEERAGFMGDMLKHVKYIQNPGYQVNSGGYDTGNYGEPALQYYAGLAAFGSGMNDPLAEELLAKGYALQVKMMDHRDKISDGSGVLTSICTAYSVGAYPWATFNFLHTLRSAAGIDGTEIWEQMKDYANFLNWMMIPDRSLPNGYADFGWGDSSHLDNALNNTMLYTHLAQIIHFYGKKYPEKARIARAVQELQPSHLQKITNEWEYPFTAYILSGFDPQEKNDAPALEVLGEKNGEHFKTFGLTVMRSGFGTDDTFAAFKGGSLQGAHQHYDENSFIIFKKGFQALDSGQRGNAPHHKVYYPQTIAHNAVLIRMKNEAMPNYWYPANAPHISEKLFNDGGQNRICAAVNLGFDSSEYHVACGGDATAAYSGEKSREAVRQFVFIKPDYFVVYDRVTSVSADQQKVFLLHTGGKPAAVAPGIWRSENQQGSLFTRTLLPVKLNSEIIGGPGNEFFTGGKNRELPPAVRSAAERRGKDNFGKYRLEISPADQTKSVRFLTLMQAADKDTAAMVPAKVISGTEYDSIEFTTLEGINCRVSFRKNGKIGGTIRLEQNGKVLLDKELLPERAVAAPQKKNLVPEGDKLVVSAAVPNGKATVSSGGFACTDNVARANFNATADRAGQLEVTLSSGSARNIRIIQVFINGKPQFAKYSVISGNAPKKLKIPCQAGTPVEISVVHQRTTAAPTEPVLAAPAAGNGKTLIQSAIKPASKRAYPVMFTAEIPGGEVAVADPGNVLDVSYPTDLASGKGVLLQYMCRENVVRNKFSVKALNDGVMTVKLTGPYTGNEPGVKNIQFIQLFINGKPQFGKYVIVSFASPKVMTVRCRAGETVTFDFLAQITAREVSK